MKQLRETSGIIHYHHPRKGHMQCELLFRIPARYVLNEWEMKEYANLTPGELSYRSVRGPAGVDRFILRMPTGGYLIGPVHIFRRPE